MGKGGWTGRGKGFGRRMCCGCCFERVTGMQDHRPDTDTLPISPHNPPQKARTYRPLPGGVKSCSNTPGRTYLPLARFCSDMQTSCRYKTGAPTFFPTFPHLSSYHLPTLPPGSGIKLDIPPPVRLPIQPHHPQPRRMVFGTTLGIAN